MRRCGILSASAYERGEDMKPRNKIQPLPFVLPALFIYILTVIINSVSMGYSLFPGMESVI